jgi:hypothetical protein
MDSGKNKINRNMFDVQQKLPTKMKKKKWVMNKKKHAFFYFITLIMRFNGIFSHTLGFVLPFLYKWVF